MVSMLRQSVKSISLEMATRSRHKASAKCKLNAGPGYKGFRNENETVSLNKSQTKRSHPVEKFLITPHIVLV